VAGSVGSGAKVGTTEFVDSAITITTSDPALLAQTFDTFTQSLSGLYAAAGEQQAAQTGTLKEILAAQTKEAAKPEGQKLNTQLLWLVGLFIAGIAAVLFIWRR
jgi:hypothetical protein